MAYRLNGVVNGVRFVHVDGASPFSLFPSERRNLPSPTVFVQHSFISALLCPKKEHQ